VSVIASASAKTVRMAACFLTRATAVPARAMLGEKPVVVGAGLTVAP
jgi:hypothetical protein